TFSEKVKKSNHMVAGKRAASVMLTPRKPFSNTAMLGAGRSGGKTSAPAVKKSAAKNRVGESNTPSRGANQPKTIAFIDLTEDGDTPPPAPPPPPKKLPFRLAEIITETAPKN
ncbi:hypothetical protein LTR33_016319, partial [Friedmanniomyces endolithicus]